MEERRQRHMMWTSSVVLIESHVLTEEEHHDQDEDVAFDVRVLVEDACRTHNGEEERSLWCHKVSLELFCLMNSQGLQKLMGNTCSSSDQKIIPNLIK